MQLNESRIKYLQTVDDIVNGMKESASKELLRVSDDNNNSYTYKKLLQAFSDDKNSYNYKKLLQALIVQVLFLSSFFFFHYHLTHDLFSSDLT